MAQILRILLDNAVRFSPRDKTVAVHLGVEHAAPALSVRDDGTGVPEEDAEVIFERFQRGRDADGEPGLGLGLASARELASRMGAPLELVHEDEGARFVVALEPAPSASLENA